MPRKYTQLINKMYVILQQIQLQFSVSRIAETFILNDTLLKHGKNWKADLSSAADVASSCNQLYGVAQ